MAIQTVFVLTLLLSFLCFIVRSVPLLSYSSKRFTCKFCAKHSDPIRFVEKKLRASKNHISQIYYTLFTISVVSNSLTYAKILSPSFIISLCACVDERMRACWSPISYHWYVFALFLCLWRASGCRSFLVSSLSKYIYVGIIVRL